MVASLVTTFVFTIIGPQGSFQGKNSVEICICNHDKELIITGLSEESRCMRDTYSFLHEVKRLVLPRETTASQAQTCSGHQNTWLHKNSIQSHMA